MTITDHALELAEQGFYVIPVKPKVKRPLLPDWEARATRNEAAIKKIFRPKDLNIGIAPGPSGKVIFDVDPRNNGDISFKQITADFGNEIFEDVPRVYTPGLGTHRYFDQPKGMQVRKGKLALDGIDILGWGSFAMAPPSYFGGDAKHPYQGTYGWVIQHGERRPFPVELLQRYKSNATPGHNNNTIKNNEPWFEHARNLHLSAFARTLLHQGFSEDDIRQIMHFTNSVKCQPPYPGKEVDAIVTSTVKRVSPGFNDRMTFLHEWQQWGIHDKAFELLAIIANSADARGTWAPNFKQLMKALNTKNEVTFYNNRNILLQFGAIEIESRGLHMSTIYRLQQAPAHHMPVTAPN